MVAAAAADHYASDTEPELEHMDSDGEQHLQPVSQAETAAAAEGLPGRCLQAPTAAALAPGVSEPAPVASTCATDAAHGTGPAPAAQQRALPAQPQVRWPEGTDPVALMKAVLAGAAGAPVTTGVPGGIQPLPVAAAAAAYEPPQPDTASNSSVASAVPGARLTRPGVPGPLLLPGAPRELLPAISSFQPFPGQPPT